MTLKLKEKTQANAAVTVYRFSLTDSVPELPVIPDPDVAAEVGAALAAARAQAQQAEEQAE